MERSCPEVSYRDLADRALIQTSTEISSRDLAKRPLIWSLYRALVGGLLPRFCQKSSYRELEISEADLAKTPLIRSLYRELAKRHPIYRDLVQRHCIYRSAEILPRGRLQRSCQGGSLRQLLQRPHKEILPRDLL